MSGRQPAVATGRSISYPPSIHTFFLLRTHMNVPYQNIPKEKSENFTLSQASKSRTMKGSTSCLSGLKVVCLVPCTYKLKDKLFAPSPNTAKTQWWRRGKIDDSNNNNDNSNDNYYYYHSGKVRKDTEQANSSAHPHRIPHGMCNMVEIMFKQASKNKKHVEEEWKEISLPWNNWIHVTFSFPLYFLIFVCVLGIY